MKYLILPFIFSCFLVNVDAQNPAAAKGDTAKYEQGPPPMVKELEVMDPIYMREVMMAQMKEIDPDFVFKRGNDVNGLPEYSATDRYNSSLEIIGNDNVSVAKWTIQFSLNNDANLIIARRLFSFVRTLEGPDGSKWFTELINKHLKGHELEVYTETQEFIKGRAITFTYVPKLLRASMTVTFKE
ncbi:MAG TPA: hypothetical protein VK668_15615 [Mucilaginibacter sp.]|nr:hypothetical protein [Mucilaginibacter sp.]